MSTLELTSTPPSRLRVDALVIGICDTDEGPVLAPTVRDLDSATKGRLLPALIALGADGSPGRIVTTATWGMLPSPVVLAVGLGSLPDEGTGSGGWDPETLRRAAGSAVRALAGTATVGLALGTGQDAVSLRAVAEGALLGAYAFRRYRTEADPSAEPVGELTLLAGSAAKDKRVRAAVADARTVAGAVHHARDLVNTPPNDLTPQVLADDAVALAGRVGLRAEVLDDAALRRAGYGGITAVGGGSANPPRMVHLSYAGRRPRGRVALVGKGVTFDSGGLSIKTAGGMPDMKTDMGGAAGVLAAMAMLPVLKPAVRVDAWLPLVENMPGGAAYRPGDVVTMYGGTTVEVRNTDAEGRMILGDAIARAAQDEPDYLLEASTLTGGQIISLGKRTAGLMGSAELCGRVHDAGDLVGEQNWIMPLPEDVRRGMRSAIADVGQVDAGMGRAGHMLQGGIFLSAFVPDGLPWAHLDVAGPAYLSESYGYLTKGATGVPARTLVATIADIAAHG